MINRVRHRTVVTLTLLGALAVAAVEGRSGKQDADLVARARAIHQRIIAIDSHVDINPQTFTTACNYAMPLRTPVTLAKMRQGGLDAAFFVVNAPWQDALTPDWYEWAYQGALAKFDAIQRLTKEIAPDQIELALTPGDVRRIVAAGKTAAVIGVEGGYSIGTDIRRVEEFYNRGARYLALVHEGHSQLADSTTGDRTGSYLHSGVSPLGKRVIAEMNRLGIMVDVSHASKEATLQTVALSTTPVIASHSAAGGLVNIPRNLGDEQLLSIRSKGGVVHAVAYGEHVRADPNMRARYAALRRIDEEFYGKDEANPAPPAEPFGAASSFDCPVEGAIQNTNRQPSDTGLTPEQSAEYAKRTAAARAKYPVPGPATIGHLIDHVDYLVSKIGIDHVGIASDFGGGGGVQGWSHAGETLNVTIELVRRGYSADQIEKLWGGNLLRVWEQVQRHATAR